MNLQCIIIDDEPVARRILEEFIGDIAYLELAGQADNPLRATSLLDSHSIDLIFLDINMPKISGIDFIKGSSTQASVVITTAYAEHAAEAYGLDVVDYLVKPIAFDRFFKACNKVKEVRELKKMAADQGAATDDHFFVKCDGQIEKVLYDDLLFAEAMLNYVMLHTTLKKMMVYVTMKGLEEQLPADRFIKVHKSFMVNMQKIRSIEGNMLCVGNEKITVSQALRDKVIDRVVKDKLIRR